MQQMKGHNIHVIEKEEGQALSLVAYVPVVTGNHERVMTINAWTTTLDGEPLKCSQPDKNTIIEDVKLIQRPSQIQE